MSASAVWQQRYCIVSGFDVTEISRYLVSRLYDSGYRIALIHLNVEFGHLKFRMGLDEPYDLDILVVIEFLDDGHHNGGVRISDSNLDRILCPFNELKLHGVTYIVDVLNVSRA